MNGESGSIDWVDLAATSPYRTAVEVTRALESGATADATAGLEELIDALNRSDKRALRSHLVRLMLHIMKWRTQPALRSKIWRATIRNARRKIVAIQDDTPSLSREVVESKWLDCEAEAAEAAEAEMDLSPSVVHLTWAEVFEVGYDLGVEAN